MQTEKRAADRGTGESPAEIPAIVAGRADCKTGGPKYSAHSFERTVLEPFECDWFCSVTKTATITISLKHSDRNPDREPNKIRSILIIREMAKQTGEFKNRLVIWRNKGCRWKKWNLSISIKCERIEKECRTVWLSGGECRAGESRSLRGQNGVFQRFRDDLRGKFFSRHFRRFEIGQKIVRICGRLRAAAAVCILFTHSFVRWVCSPNFRTLQDFNFKAPLTVHLIEAASLAASVSTLGFDCLRKQHAWLSKKSKSQKRRTYIFRRRQIRCVSCVWCGRESVLAFKSV